MKRLLLFVLVLVLLSWSSAVAFDGVNIKYTKVKGQGMPGFLIKNTTGSSVTVRAKVSVPTNPQSKWSLEQYKAGGTVGAGDNGFISLFKFKTKDGDVMDPAQIIWKKNQRPKEGCVFTFDVSAGGKKDTIWISLKSLYP